jgi:primary-amine oxidase
VNKPIQQVCLAALAALLLTAAAGGVAPRPAAASAGQYCSGQALATGANWSVCWEIRANEGLAITHAFYTKAGFDRRVSSDMTVAQIFVPYEVGQPRYHDVAYGLGAAMQPIAAAECAGGTLLASARVCRQMTPAHHHERFCAQGSCRYMLGQALSLWSSSQMGAYNYITRWTFHPDGHIEPEVGLAGVLQFGRTAHIHNVYWRLDLDIDDPAGDTVEEFFRVVPANNDGSRGAFGWNPLLAETFRPNELNTFRKWRVKDTSKTNVHGRNWSYELVPNPRQGNLRTTPAEGFSRGELWATVARPNERFVSTETADYLSTYLNGESLASTDVVLWYVMHEHHEVRDEDSPYMPLEWMGFELRPRDFFDQNPMD